MKEKKENRSMQISPELVEKAKAGDRDAFSKLYQQTSTALYRSIHSMVHDDDLAWDIQQETYLKAFQSLDKLEHNEAFLPWLRRISVHEVTSTMRKRLPLSFSDLGDEDDGAPDWVDPSTDTQPELSLDRKETSRLVREILADLPEEQHLVVGMRYYEDLSISEIAELLHISQSTVRTQLSRGRKRVEASVRALEKQGIKLYGLSPMGFLAALMRRAEPSSAEAAKQAAVLTTVQAAAGGANTAAAAAVPVAVKTFGQVLTGRLLVGVLSVALIGFGIWGGAKLLRSNRTDAPYQPTRTVTPEDRTSTNASDAPTEHVDARPEETAAPVEPARPNSSETPTELVDKLFASGEPALTLHFADSGAFNTYSIAEWYLGRFQVLLRSFHWTELETTETVTGDYWLTAVSADGTVSMTFCSDGGAGTVQYSEGGSTTVWTATPPAGASISIAEEIRYEYYNLDVDCTRISFNLEGNAEEAADYFVHDAFPAHMANLAPENGYGFSDYDVVEWNVREVSKDGEAVVGSFRCAFIPWDFESSDLWAGNTVEGTGEYEGKWTFFREFVLQRQDDGLWHCVEIGTGGCALPES